MADVLSGVEWGAIERPADWQEGGLPYATHHGVFNIGGCELKCYRLNTGQAVFDADDVHKFFGAMEGQ